MYIEQLENIRFDQIEEGDLTLETVTDLQDSLGNYVDLIIKHMKSAIDDKQDVPKGLGTFRELGSGCKLKQEECTNNNAVASKIENIVNPIKIKTLLKDLAAVEQSMIKFSSTSFSSTLQISNDSKRIISSIEKLDKNFDQIISLKEEYRTAYVVGAFLDLLGVLENMYSSSNNSSTNVFRTIAVCYYALDNDAELIDISNDDEEDEKASKNELACSYNKIQYGKEIMTKFRTVCIRIFNKVFGDIQSMVNRWSD